MNRQTELQQMLAEEAADWLDRLQVEPVAESERDEFAGRLTSSPEFVGTFLQTSALHTQVSQLLKSEPDWLEPLMSDTRDQLAAGQRQVVSLDSLRSAAAAKKPRRHVGWRPFAIAATLVITLLATLVATNTLRVPGWQTTENIRQFATAFGEQRSVVLDDGSLITLNTNSVVNVQMDRNLRRVDVVRGEVLFDVIKDSNRPFQVNGKTAAVEVLGTRFNFYQKTDQTIVTVTEGKVAVGAVQNPGGSRTSPMRTELSAGQQVSINRGNMTMQPVAADLQRATAWLQRRLVFNQDTLQTVVSEFNRYNRDRLIITSRELQKRRMTGVFNANDTEGFLALLTSIASVYVETAPDGARYIYQKAE